MIENYQQAFQDKYGNEEVNLLSPILTIRDDYASPFSSGSNGYLTQVRIRDGHFEFYHNFWGPGWLTIREIRKSYPGVSKKLSYAIFKLLQQ